MRRKVVWDEGKNEWLKVHRGISFSDFEDQVLEQKFIALLENPTRQNQSMFICRYKNYTYAIPFVKEGRRTIVLKTIYPSRKYHKLFGGENDEL